MEGRLAFPLWLRGGRRLHCRTHCLCRRLGCRSEYRGVGSLGDDQDDRLVSTFFVEVFVELQTELADVDPNPTVF